MSHSELLTNLMSDVVHKPLDIRTREKADLTLDKLGRYIKFLAKRKRELKVEVEEKL